MVDRLGAAEVSIPKFLVSKHPKQDFEADYRLSMEKVDVDDI